MKIEQVLANIRGSQSEKVAAEKPVAAPAPKTAASVPTDALKTAMSDALKAGEKTAAEQAKPGPVEEVMKVAAEMANAEMDAAVKQAQILGAALYDGAVARAAQYQKAAEELPAAPAKIASTQDPEFSKFASENPELVKQAAQLGYDQTRAGLEKMADDAYTKGWNDTVEAIYKTAATEFMKAAQITGSMVEQYQATVAK
jgi:NADH dehydrogenase/NADH:ubiquinone oxidoreductase subunit G